MINLYGNIAEDKTVSATGSYNATATESSGVWVMQVRYLQGRSLRVRKVRQGLACPVFNGASEFAPGSARRQLE